MSFTGFFTKFVASDAGPQAEKVSAFVLLLNASYDLEIIKFITSKAVDEMTATMTSEAVPKRATAWLLFGTWLASRDSHVEEII